MGAIQRDLFEMFNQPTPAPVVAAAVAATVVAPVVRKPLVIEMPQVAKQVLMERGRWSNTATEHADLYICNDQKAQEKAMSFMDAACNIDPKKLEKAFPVIYRAEDEDDEETGYLHGTLYLESWVEGKVNWSEIALSLTEDKRTERAAATVEDMVIQVLSAATVEGNLIKLNSGQLDKSLYAKVDAALCALGGKWNRKLGGHVFADDPSDAFDTLLLTGKYVKPDNLGFFPTQDALADVVIEKADLRPGMTMLEPSVGTAALLSRAAMLVGDENAYGVEYQEGLCKKLLENGYNVLQGDFLSRNTWHLEGGFDRIVMNPPFAKQADIDHVLHAWSMLKPGGRLVAIMSAGVTYRTNRKTVEFRELVESCGSMENNPEGSFKASGTNVSTVTVVLDKPELS